MGGNAKLLHPQAACCLAKESACRGHLSAGHVPQEQKVPGARVVASAVLGEKGSNDAQSGLSSGRLRAVWWRHLIMEGQPGWMGASWQEAGHLRKLLGSGWEGR